MSIETTGHVISWIEAKRWKDRIDEWVVRCTCGFEDTARTRDAATAAWYGHWLRVKDGGNE